MLVSHFSIEFFFKKWPQIERFGEVDRRHLGVSPDVCGPTVDRIELDTKDIL